MTNGHYTVQPSYIFVESVATDAKLTCPHSCHTTPLMFLVCLALYHCQCLQAAQECWRLHSVTVGFNSLYWVDFSSSVPKELWKLTHVLIIEDLMFDFVSLQIVSLSPTTEINSMDSPSAFCNTTSAESTPLNTKNPSFEAQLPEDSKQRVNKGFRVSEILGTTNSYHNSILEFFTNFAK